MNKKMAQMVDDNRANYSSLIILFQKFFKALEPVSNIQKHLPHSTGPHFKDFCLAIVAAVINKSKAVIQISPCGIHFGFLEKISMHEESVSVPKLVLDWKKKTPHLSKAFVASCDNTIWPIAQEISEYISTMEQSWTLDDILNFVDNFRQNYPRHYAWPCELAYALWMLESACFWEYQYDYVSSRLPETEEERAQRELAQEIIARRESEQRAKSPEQIAQEAKLTQEIIARRESEQRAKSSKQKAQDAEQTKKILAERAARLAAIKKM